MTLLVLSAAVLVLSAAVIVLGPPAPVLQPQPAFATARVVAFLDFRPSSVFPPRSAEDSITSTSTARAEHEYDPAGLTFLGAIRPLETGSVEDSITSTSTARAEHEYDPAGLTFLGAIRPLDNGNAAINLHYQRKR